MCLGVSLLDHLTDVEPTKFALSANNLAILLVIAPTPEIGIDRMIMKISMKMELLVVEHGKKHIKMAYNMKWHQKHYLTL
jgi:hypothetical protein